MLRCSTRYRLLLSVILAPLLLAPWAWAGQVLSGDEIRDLVTDKTTGCLKEKDQSTCTTYFSPEGVMKRRMHDTGARKDARWFVDDADRLCILWPKRTKALCLVVTENEDGTYALTKRTEDGKHVSSITEFGDGNTEGL